MTEIITTVCPRVGGFFKLQAVRLDGTVRPLTGWFPNLVTDSGLNRIGSGTYMNACHVGTNNTAPAVTDTGLAGYVAGSTTIIAASNGQQGTAPYYGWARRTYRFGVGVATGNLSEVGIATARTNGGATIMFSRALILDELGDPTTVTVLSDEILDVTYECRLYPPLTDTTQTVTITGSGSHDIITRAMQVTGHTGWKSFIGNQMTFQPNGGNVVAAYPNDIGAITGSPAGSPYGSGLCYNTAYGNNNLYLNGGAAFSLAQGVVPGGIRSISWTSSLGAYQQQFDPVIDKTAVKTLSIVFRVAWARNT